MLPIVDRIVFVCVCVCVFSFPLSYCATLRFASLIYLEDITNTSVLLLLQFLT